MRITYRITPEIKALLKKHDQLGFSSLHECAQAILTHPDWSTRWDMVGFDEDVETIEDWKEEIEESNMQAPPHGSLYGEPCDDRY